MTDYAVESEEGYDEALADAYQDYADEAYAAPLEAEEAPEPEADQEPLALFEELGESVSETPAALDFEEPEDLVDSLKDTSPLPELPEQDPHTLETVLGQAALETDDLDEYLEAEETVADEEVDWDPAMLFGQEAEAEQSQIDEQPEWNEDTLFEQEAAAEPEVEPDFADDWALAVDDSADDATQVIAAEAETLEPTYADIEVHDQDDPYIAQIALSLTQMSLELTAEATILTNEDEIVAIAGELEPNEVEEIRDTIADDWDANADEARIRFITLESNGKEYMLYSRRTVGDFTLSMIFGGMTPLRDIRRQGKRLLDALEAVPDLLDESEIPELATIPEPVPSTTLTPAQVDDETFQPFTYLWLLRDPDYSFEDHTQKAITAGLTMQLGELGWHVNSLTTEAEYVYLRADVPGERPAHEIIADLKRRAADIARGQEAVEDPDSLWADSYLVMMPGRDLDPDEISQFIDFERMF
jgi:hypothetical protein